MCWIEFVILNGGVVVFLKNYLLVCLIECMLGWKEKEVIKEVLKNCKGKLEGVEIVLKEMEDCYEIFRS